MRLLKVFQVEPPIAIAGQPAVVLEPSERGG